MRSPVGRIIVRILAVLLCAASMFVSYGLSLKHLKAGDSPATQPAGTTQPTTRPATQPAAAAESLNFLDQACTTLLPNTNCEEVIKSEWGSVSFPFSSEKIPLAKVGLFYFTCLFWWFLLIGDVSPSRAWVHVLISCVMAAGLGMSVFLLYQMSRLPTWCPLCSATHIANFLLFVGLLLLWPRNERPAATGPAEPSPPEGAGLFAPIPERAVRVERVWPHWWMLAVTPIVALLSVAIEAMALQPRMSIPLTDAQLEIKLKGETQLREYYEKQYKHYNTRWEHTFTEWQISPVATIRTEGEPVRGPADARHTIIVFSDFQCPTCKSFEETLSTRIVAMAARYGGVRIIFKQWPISTACNPVALRDLHPMACEAAIAAEAAFMVGGNDAFWRMHDQLFKNQEEWKRTASFDKYALEAGIQLDAFHAAMKSPEAMERVKSDVLEGVNIGKDLVQREAMTEDDRTFIKVDGTPSVFVDNKRLPTLSHVRAWDLILRQPPPGQQPVTPPRARPRPTTQPFGPRVSPGS